VGNFENVRLEFRVQVPEGVSYRSVLETVKKVMDREEAVIRKEYA
jgi:hypothetical protein